MKRNSLGTSECVSNREWNEMEINHKFYRENLL